MATLNMDLNAVPEPVPSDVRSKTKSFNIGTRKSKLALVQTELVVEALEKAWPDYDFQVHARNTAAGDIDKMTPFKDMPVKNLWTHELEQLMTENKLDLLVHSLKGTMKPNSNTVTGSDLSEVYPLTASSDVPTQIPPSCAISGIIARADPRDAFVLKSGRSPCNLEDLPAGAVIGTSSIRRTAQIAFKHPHLKVHDIRGNVPTRLTKLDADGSPFDALVLGASGLIRLGLEDRITQYLDSAHGGMLYAVGQGAIGIELRADDELMNEILAKIEDNPTTLACLTERSLLRTLEGGCSAPLGVETKWIKGQGEVLSLQLKALVVSVNGTESAEIQISEIVDNKAQAEDFGVRAAEELLHKGADRILAAIQAKKMTKPSDLGEI